MANAGPAKNQTVEEILASIRQAITEDDAKKRDERFQQRSRPPLKRREARAEAPAPEEPDEEPEAEEAPEHEAHAEQEREGQAAPTDPDSDPRMREMIDRAIEQALEGVRAELESDPETTRAEPSASRPGQGPARVDRQAQRPRTRTEVARALPRREVLRPGQPLLSPRSGAAVSASFGELARSMGGNAGQMEELVEEMLKPMLRAWLDDNLPSMVERLVREEIERVSRGRR